MRNAAPWRSRRAPTLLEDGSSRVTTSPSRAATILLTGPTGRFEGSLPLTVSASALERSALGGVAEDELVAHLDTAAGRLARGKFHHALGALAASDLPRRYLR